MLIYSADALFICYQIDRELGGAHSEQAKEAVRLITSVELPRRATSVLIMTVFDREAQCGIHSCVMVGDHHRSRLCRIDIQVYSKDLCRTVELYTMSLLPLGRVFVLHATCLPEAFAGYSYISMRFCTNGKQSSRDELVELFTHGFSAGRVLTCRVSIFPPRMP